MWFTFPAYCGSEVTFFELTSTGFSAYMGSHTPNFIFFLSVCECAHITGCTEEVGILGPGNEGEGWESYFSRNTKFLFLSFPVSLINILIECIHSLKTSHVITLGVFLCCHWRSVDEGNRKGCPLLRRIIPPFGSEMEAAKLTEQGPVLTHTYYMPAAGFWCVFFFFFNSSVVDM